MDLSKLNLDSLFAALKGRSLDNFLSQRVFKNQADYAAQTPSIYPLGVLYLQDGDWTRSGEDIWLNEDKTIRVFVNQNGIITMVRPAVATTVRPPE